MNKSQIADILINQSSNGIPVFLNIDDEPIGINIKKTGGGILIMGQNITPRINDIVSQFDQSCITNIATPNDLNVLYKDFVSHYKNCQCYSPYHIAVINDINVFNNAQCKPHLIPILSRGNGIKLFFIAGMSSSTINDIPITANFAVRINEYYVDTKKKISEADFDYIGKIQKIKLS